MWWKRHYNYSSNDEAYLTVTETQMYEDYLDYKIMNYREKYPDKFIENTAKARAVNPNFDQQTNEAFKEALKNIEMVKL